MRSRDTSSPSSTGWLECRCAPDYNGHVEGVSGPYEVDPGSGFRFAVGSETGAHSTIYRVWSAKNASDLYLTAIPLGKTQKISLHESGNWRHSFLSEVAMGYVQRNADRHIEQWRRPTPTIPGFTRAYSITIPRTELRFTTQDLTDIRWAADPGHGYWVRIEVILMDPSGAGTTVTWDEAQILGRLQLENNHRALVLAQRFRPDKAAAQRIGAYRDLFLAGEMAEEMTRTEFPVVGLHGHQDDGARTLTELAMSTPPREVRVICTGRPQQPPARVEMRWRNPHLRVSGAIDQAPSGG